MNYFSGSWFPVYTDQLNNPDFAKLSSTAKLYCWLVSSEYNMHGEFYRSDAWFAAALGCSIETIRKIRPKLAKLGWIQFISGKQIPGKQNLATQYKLVKWATVSEEQGGQFAQMHRFAFNAMLSRIRKQTFTHDDVMIYVYLNYWEWVHAFQNEQSKDFFISKRDLRQLTGVQVELAMRSIRNLYDQFSFNGGNSLFEFTDEYHKVKVTPLARFADPSEDEKSRDIAERYYYEIEERAKQISQEDSEKKQAQKLKKQAVSIPGKQ